MANLIDRSSHFEFGKNWADFARTIDDVRTQAAIDGVQKLVPDLTGKSFLDIGCGSGLSSLAALKLGASRVLATDIDEHSVETTRQVLTRKAPSPNWSTQRLSVFGMSADTLGTFDVVYSWGVLHHTGDMQRAIRRAVSLVKPGGLLAISIYNKTACCGFWRLEKMLYSKSPRSLQAAVQATYMTAFMLGLTMRGKNPAAFVKDYRHKRGMKWTNDVHDWLGGYPYESASADDIISLLSDMELVRSFPLPPSLGIFGTGCSEFVFCRR